MNVFDFDNTIYDGESSFDFFKFCIRKKLSLVKHMPKVAAMLLKYKTSRVSRAEVMDFASQMLVVLAENESGLKTTLKQFWAENRNKLKPSILSLVSEGDVIISASPSFIFDEIRNDLGGADIISTQVDIKQMKITSLCYGENKVTEFKNRYGQIRPDNYYTDNLNDTPMLALAERAWLVSGSKITPYRQ
jgi:HAD superfamily phosphoserine phosphatase-like hydrolase